MAFIKQMIKEHGDGGVFDPSRARDNLIRVGTKGGHSHYARIGLDDEGEVVALFIAVVHPMTWQERRVYSIVCCYCIEGGAFCLFRMIRRFMRQVKKQPIIRVVQIGSQTQLDSVLIDYLVKYKKHLPYKVTRHGLV